MGFLIDKCWASNVRPPKPMMSFFKLLRMKGKASCDINRGRFAGSAQVYHQVRSVAVSLALGKQSPSYDLRNNKSSHNEPKGIE